MWSRLDIQFMGKALELARLGQGLVEPNPMVGCVIARGRRVVGAGYHRRYGGPHAEVHALRQAGALAAGATAYISLEPCSHVGKTPPCADALICAGVARVVAAMRDPNPIVRGHGLSRLRRAGVRVEVGLLEDEAARLNAPFVTLHCKKRPYVILKWAQSIDGCIATKTGDSRWISSPESRRAVHLIRARVDGVMIGIGTALRDDPDLTARGVRVARRAARIVLDTQLRLSLRSKLARTAKSVPTILFCSLAALRSRRAGLLRRLGCDVVGVPHGRGGLKIESVMGNLAARKMSNVLVEGGGRLLGSLVDRGLFDEARVFVAPILIGGRGAPGPLMGLGPAGISNRPRILVEHIEAFGPDLCYTIRFD
jgi:diaminohydroxyphosphoribosylaminopyrimidine deaminase/5-amino-6-(5-phosphoribosylamino)uracil reductase